MYGYEHRQTAESYRLDAKRDYYRARKDARFAAEQYARSAELRRHARWLTRHPDLWGDEIGYPADYEHTARVTEHLADTMLRASFRSTTMARFHTDLARRYDAMAAR